MRFDQEQNTRRKGGGWSRKGAERVSGPCSLAIILLIFILQGYVVQRELSSELSSCAVMWYLYVSVIWAKVYWFSLPILNYASSDLFEALFCICQPQAIWSTACLRITGRARQERPDQWLACFNWLSTAGAAWSTVGLLITSVERLGWLGHSY